MNTVSQQTDDAIFTAEETLESLQTLKELKFDDAIMSSLCHHLGSDYVHTVLLEMAKLAVMTSHQSDDEVPNTTSDQELVAGASTIVLNDQTVNKFLDVNSEAELITTDFHGCCYDFPPLLDIRVKQCDEDLIQRVIHMNVNLAKSQISRLIGKFVRKSDAFNIAFRKYHDAIFGKHTRIFPKIDSIWEECFQSHLKRKHRLVIIERTIIMLIIERMHLQSLITDDVRWKFDEKANTLRMNIPPFDPRDTMILNNVYVTFQP